MNYHNCKFSFFVQPVASSTNCTHSVLHRFYFNALLQLKHYDKFFILATQLAQQLEGYPFSNVLLKLMEDVALPKISNFFCVDCIEGARNSGGTQLHRCRQMYTQLL